MRSSIPHVGATSGPQLEMDQDFSFCIRTASLEEACWLFVVWLGRLTCCCVLNQLSFLNATPQQPLSATHSSDSLRPHQKIGSVVELVTWRQVCTTPRDEQAIDDIKAMANLNTELEAPNYKACTFMHVHTSCLVVLHVTAYFSMPETATKKRCALI